MAAWARGFAALAARSATLANMILRAKDGTTRWVWVKIPRTATHSYQNLFFPAAPTLEEPHHWHVPYSAQAQRGGLLPGVSVVRHPLTRFISSLKYIVGYPCTTAGCERHENLVVPSTTMKELCDFLQSTFDKNCRVKVDDFAAAFGVKNSMFVGSFFITQTTLAYHPKVTIFKYENLPAFNRWIETELGHDISQLQHVNRANSEKLAHLNFKDPKFIQVVENMFHDDYQAFGYDFTT